MKKIFYVFSFLSLVAITKAQTVADFENLFLATDTFWDGSDLSGGFSSGNAFFPNNYNAQFMSWNGFTYSNKTDSNTVGIGNQYAAITASGYSGSANYAIANEYGNTRILLSGSSAGKLVQGFYLTNTTYAYTSMRDGDAFAKKFGGTSGNDEDWFKLTVLGWFNGALKANSVDFYLADYRFADNRNDYIVRDWIWLDLLPLGNVDSITFYLSSSDTGQFGMNTPAYFAIDNFTAADELNATPVAVDDEVTTNYLTDTLIDVTINDIDTGATPALVTLIGQPLIPGATDTVIDNKIYYVPALGIVTVDTLYYQLCNETNQCSTAKVVVRVNGITAIDEMTYQDVSVFPNPILHGNLIINTGNSINTVIELINLSGQRLGLYRSNSNIALVPFDELPSGIYIVRVTDGQSIFVHKVVKN